MIIRRAIITKEGRDRLGSLMEEEYDTHWMSTTATYAYKQQVICRHVILLRNNKVSDIIYANCKKLYASEDIDKDYWVIVSRDLDSLKARVELEMRDRG